MVFAARPISKITPFATGLALQAVLGTDLLVTGQEIRTAEV